MKLRDSLTTVWGAEIVGTVYTVRWQIELIFKNWKSQLQINYLKGINPKNKKKIKKMLGKRDNFTKNEGSDYILSTVWMPRSSRPCFITLATVSQRSKREFCSGLPSTRQSRKKALNFSANPYK